MAERKARYLALELDKKVPIDCTLLFTTDKFVNEQKILYFKNEFCSNIFLNPRFESRKPLNMQTERFNCYAFLYFVEFQTREEGKALLRQISQLRILESAPSLKGLPFEQRGARDDMDLGQSTIDSQSTPQYSMTSRTFSS